MNKIILLSFDYPPNNGGISRLCKEIVKEFIRRGQPYHVVTNVQNDKESDSDVTRICGSRGIVEYKILRYLRKSTSKNDIILCDTWHPAGSLAKLSGRKYCILAHGAEYLPGVTFFRNKVFPIYRRLILKGARSIVANSHYTANLVNSLCNGINTRAIPLAIDSNAYIPTKEKISDDNVLRICSISRLEKFKGHDFILSTIAQLPTDYKTRIRLEIGGKGPYKETLESLTHNLGLDDIVSFLGFIPEDKMNDFYSRNDLFILCTREERDLCNVEGFGLVFVEAQACGTAVIGTNAGGIPDAIHNGYGGWLITPDSTEDLSSLLMRFIDDKQMIHKEGKVARRRVIEECSQKQYVDSLINAIYEQR